MDTGKFTTCALRLNHLQAFYITFTPNAVGIQGLRRLIGVAGADQGIRIEQSQITGLVAVAESGAWEQVPKTVTVFGASYMSTGDLAVIAPYVESVRAGQHFADGIFTNSTKKRDEAFKTVTGTISPAFKYEMQEWGVKIDPKLIEIQGLPAIQFNVTDINTSAHLFAFVIDGWSGMYGIQKMGISMPDWKNQRFSDGQGIREQIRSAVMEYLDQATMATV